MQADVPARRRSVEADGTGGPVAPRPGDGRPPHERSPRDPAVRLVAATVVGLLGGLAAGVVGLRFASALLLGGATAVALVTALLGTVEAVRQRRPGVDVIAVLAMAGALALGELEAGAVIAVMLTGGQALEGFAEGRARRELSSLLSRAPRTTHRLEGDRVRDVAVDRVRAGDVLLVKSGEVLPVDGMLLQHRATLDESALTGESRPTDVDPGALLRSGALNAGSALRMRANAAAADSTYAGIVRLVEQAASQRSPFVRLADRSAGWFVVVTLLLAAAAWAWSGDPVRALAVLVVATPCPLILAAPVAIVGGLGAAARGGVIIKGGSALEALAGAQVVLLDKTGTLTAGRPHVSRVKTTSGTGVDELLRVAGSLEQLSLHPFAPAIVAAATEGGQDLPLPTDVEESFGSGIRGRVEGREVRVGQLGFVGDATRVPPELQRLRRMSHLEGGSTVHVAIDGVLAGAIVLRDPLRPESPRVLRDLRRLGMRETIMVTGDRLEVAQLIADAVGMDRVMADRAPHEKVDAVREARAAGSVLMVGDGINDAPALALADVGAAMGPRGASAATEAADVVLTLDRLEALPRAIVVARRTRRIARQSVLAGMGMSLVAMGAAAAGLLAPVVGALLQEGIDLVVILNALRAVRGPRARSPAVEVPPEVDRLLVEHAHHRRQLDDLDRLAGTLDLDVMSAEEVRAQLTAVRDYLELELLPHELQEERELYPAVASAFPGEDPTAPMARTHREIVRTVRLFGRLLDELPGGVPDAVDLVDAQRLLWTLHAILGLHFALEDELYSVLTAGAPQHPTPRSRPGPEPSALAPPGAPRRDGDPAERGP